MRASGTACSKRGAEGWVGIFGDGLFGPSDRRERRSVGVGLRRGPVSVRGQPPSRTGRRRGRVGIGRVPVSVRGQPPSRTGRRRGRVGRLRSGGRRVGERRYLG